MKTFQNLDMNFDKSCNWFAILMWFWVEKVLKLTNLTKWVEQPKSCTGDENSTKNWKNELDFIWKDFHSGLWRKNSHSILRCISWDSIENKFLQSVMKKFVSWGSMKEKVWSLVKKCFVFWKWCEKFKFSYFEKFSHFTNFDKMKILENLNKILFTLGNLKQTLTLSLSSCSTKLKCANESHGVKNGGLYRNYRQRVTQYSSNKWFIILRKH